MSCHLKHSTTGLALVLCCFLAMTLPVKAATSSDPDRWAFGGSAYLWAAGVEGTDAAGDQGAAARVRTQEKTVANFRLVSIAQDSVQFSIRAY